MLELTNEFKEKVVAGILKVRENYDGSDSAFSKKLGINNTVYSRLINGGRDGLLKDTQWLSLGRELGINPGERRWNMARTDVFNIIEEDVQFCQQYSKAKICVDDCGIGKTFTAKYLSRTLKNCFYIDASQGKTKQAFVRLMAKEIGIDNKGRYSDIKANIKYYLKMLPQPIVMIDEAGDMDYPTFLELKEFWNATDGTCGWYMMGADGLRAKIERGINSRKVGYRELFSRYSEKYTTIVPNGKQDRMSFYKKLITDVLSVNMQDKESLSLLVKKCLSTDEEGYIGGLRRAESMLILHS